MSRIKNRSRVVGYVPKGGIVIVIVVFALARIFFHYLYVFFFVSASCALRRHGRASLSLSFFDCGEFYGSSSVSISEFSLYLDNIC